MSEQPCLLRHRWLDTVVWLNFLVLIGAPIVSAQSDQPQWQTLDAQIRQIQADWHVPGLAVGIVKNDELVFARGYGVRHLDHTDPVDADTLFVIASNTKAFVTTSLAILVDEGKLNWDERATTYLPELRLYDRLATQEITVRDLVSHRSGLGTFSGDLLWYETHYSPAEILRRVQWLKPTFSFRSQYGYQNLMYIAAGQILERVTGKPCADFVRERILQPLGMERTTVSVREFRDNVAMPHNESGGSLRALRHSAVDHCWGACGLNSSVNDLSRWLRMHLNAGRFNEQRIISERQAWELTQAVTPIHIARETAADLPQRNFLAYGLGWVLYDFHGRKVIGHGGGLDGMISQTAFVPAENLGIIVLTNSETPVASIIRDTILEAQFGVSSPRDWNQHARTRRQRQQAVQREKDLQTVASRVPDAPQSLSNEQLAGRYRCPFYGDVLVVSTDDKLEMRFVPAPHLVADLHHWHFHTFEIKWRPSVNYNFPRGFVNFTLDTQGRPDRLVIDQPNDDFWFYELDLRRVHEPE